MKHRQPDQEKYTCPDWHASSAEALWRTLEVTTITPIYGGGVTAGEPDREMPIRVSTIRGQLRFWWRLLNFKKYNNSQELFKAERDIWGGMAEFVKTDHKESKVVGPSKVKIRVSEIENCKIEACAKYEWEKRRDRECYGSPKFKSNMHAYALFPGQGKLKNRGQEIEIHPADVIMPELKFSLQFACDDETWKDIQTTLRWWASFGGLGARTRRGLGSIQIKGLAPVTEEEVIAVGGRLKCKPETDKAMQAWNTAIASLQKFRQGENEGRNPGTDPKVPRRLGRSRWPEPDAIRRRTGRIRQKADGTTLTPKAEPGDVFPRALFGMPIIFHFQGEKGDRARDPGDTELVPENADRYSSPLILKAMWNGKRYQSIALLLPTADELLSHTLVLKNSGQGRDLSSPVSFGANAWWPSDKKKAAKLGAKIDPMKDRDETNPLLAFLAFF